MDWCTVAAILSFIVAGSINCESIANNGSPIKYHEQNRFVKLICRDDTTIVVGIENEFGEAQVIGKMGETYMVIINNRDETKLPPKTVYLLKKPIAAVKNLIPLTSYNISADLMTGDFQYTAKKHFMEFRTLGENYVPGNVTNIYTDEFSLSADGNGVDVTVLWDPNEDRTCAYNLFFHTRDYNPKSEIFSVREFNQNQPEELYRHELKQLDFGTEYAIGVQALNDKNETLKSEIWWHVITTPSCLELYNGSATLCSPYGPENITVEVKPTTTDKRYNFNVTWTTPSVFPNYYTIDIIDYESGLRQIFNASNGTINSVQLNDVEVNGFNFEIFVTAHATAGDSAGFYRGKIDPAIIYGPSNTDYTTIGFVTGSMLAIIVIVVILSVKFGLCQPGKFIRDQIKLETKPTQDSIIYDSQLRTKEQLDQICALQTDYNFENDPMELNPALVQTLEIVGEGAFGCVRRAVLLPDKHIVAVKMLKSCPSYADVRNFYREIEVMKSVPKHPNILGIVGHCTKNVFGLMLLTEYCSEGNLLDFLRNIFDDQLWEQDRVQKVESVEGDSMEAKMNFAPLRKDSAYESTSSSRISIAENQGYDFDPSASRMCIVENHGYGFDIGNNQVEKAITEIDLLSFACQVANGMNFLSKKKVVHRDLACRNVLVLADRTAKISDFGLSRDIYQENLYKKCGAGLLPIKWLALESMTHQVYSTQSDVWSFGVLLYEIVTKGAVPYPTVDTKDILDFLRDGRRMDRPSGCRADIYNLMLHCWNAVPTERPTFKMIQDELIHIMREMNASSMM